VYPANIPDIIFGQDGGAIQFAVLLFAPSLLATVDTVILVSASNQMLWVATPGIVASVQNNQPPGDGTIG
jgi:branched-subunit amino acid transport protein